MTTDNTQANQRTPRPAIIEGDIAKLPLGVGAKDGYAIVDAEYAYLDKHKWILETRGYVSTAINRKPVRLQYFIIGERRKGMEIDHVNGDKLDNRTDNLRLATRSQNNANRAATANRKNSPYKGVTLWPWGRWSAKIGVNGKKITLGSFGTAEEAAKAYNAAALKYHGEFARLNEIGE